MTAGTSLDRTHLPLRHWFDAVARMAAPAAVSSRALARELGLRVETAWRMLHRCRAELAPSRPVVEGVVAASRSVLRVRLLRGERRMPVDPRATRPLITVTRTAPPESPGVSLHVAGEPLTDALEALATDRSDATVAARRLARLLARPYFGVSYRWLRRYLDEFGFRWQVGADGAPLLIARLIRGAVRRWRVLVPPELDAYGALLHRRHPTLWFRNGSTRAFQLAAR